MHSRRPAGAVLLACTLALAAASSAAAQGAHAPAAAPGTSARRPTRPSLVVVLVVDQFRGDYVDRYGHQWRHGLRRLFDEGAYYTEAAYRYASTMTCAGHATIGTGATPQIHGLISNVWYDRAAGRDMACTEDPTVTNVAYGPAPARTGDSGRHIATPTLADEMRAQLGPSTRVVTFSMKARAAISLAGHRSTLSAWFDGPRGFVTSPVLNGPERHPFLAKYLAAHPVERDVEAVWTRTLPPQAYLYADNGAGEAGTGAEFPHRLAAPPADGRLDQAYYANWQMSPYADAYLGQMAAAAVSEMRLGRGPGTDFLAVSFSALDTVGHAYGPRSHEVQDVLVRLDATIGRLVEALDARVGRDRYTLALTADHGVSPIPEQMRDLGLGGGIVDRKAIAGVLAASLGGSLLDSLTGAELYLSRDAAARLTTLDDRAWESLRSSFEQIDGVTRVWRTSDLLAGRYEAESDPLAHATRLSAYPNRSGDLIYITDPYWFPYKITATHGTPYKYDQHVPVVFSGPQFRRGRYTAAASPADIAPTLGRLIGVTLPASDGTVRSDAFAAPPGLPAAVAARTAPAMGHPSP